MIIPQPVRLVDDVLALTDAPADGDTVLGDYANRVAVARRVDRGADPRLDPLEDIVCVTDGDTGLNRGEAYDEDGSVLGSPEYPVDGTAFDDISGCGNDPDGSATGVATAAQVVGQPLRKIDQGSHYRRENAPFRIRIERTHATGNPDPNWDGHGFKAILTTEANNRNPASYSMFVFDSGWNYLYVNPTFTWSEEDEAWINETPIGNRTDNEQVLYLRCGQHVTHENGQVEVPLGEGIERLFWENVRGQGPTRSVIAGGNGNGSGNGNGGSSGR